MYLHNKPTFIFNIKIKTRIHCVIVYYMKCYIHVPLAHNTDVFEKTNILGQNLESLLVTWRWALMWIPCDQSGSPSTNYIYKEHGEPSLYHFSREILSPWIAHFFPCRYAQYDQKRKWSPPILSIQASISSLLKWN